MTIVRNLPEQLILAHAPWALGGFLIACIVGCAAAGLALLFAGETAGLWTVLFGTLIPLVLFGTLVKRDQAIFDAVAGRIILQRRSLWQYHQTSYPLDDLDGAEVQRLSDNARPVLLFRQMRLPLVEAYMPGNGPMETVRAIDAWLVQFENNRK